MKRSEHLSLFADIDKAFCYNDELSLFDSKQLQRLENTCVVVLLFGLLLLLA